MNIFVTSKNPRVCARNLDDKRVVKMINESFQLMATALAERGIVTPIRPTHRHHPVAIWSRSTRENYNWLLRHAIALCHEKRRRYPDNKPHEYEKLISFFRSHAKVLPSFKLTAFVNCAANKEKGIDYKHIDDVFLAYQLYLNDRWETDARTPTWYKQAR